jgi:hypothetical protein
MNDNTACPANTYSATGTAPGSGTCFSCPAGSDTRGVNNNTAVSACLGTVRWKGFRLGFV